MAWKPDKMSKQSEAKIKQNYVAKAVPKTCSTCAFFELERVQAESPPVLRSDGWWEEKSLRCGVGGFIVKKTAICDCYQAKQQTEAINAI